MDRARLWPPADRLRALDRSLAGAWDAWQPPQPWVPVLRSHSGRAMVWALVADLIDAVMDRADTLPSPAGVTGLDRLSWALGGSPGYVDRLLSPDGETFPQAGDLGALLWLAGVDRAGLEAKAGLVTVSSLVAGAGLDGEFLAAAAQAEAGTAALASPGWVRQAAAEARLDEDGLARAWVAGALSWTAGATATSGGASSRQALVREGAATLWRRKLLGLGVGVPSEWVVLDGHGTLADLAGVMDEVGDGPPATPLEHWEWRVPATGLVLTPDTVRRGMLLLGCLDLQAAPGLARSGKQAGSWAVADSTAVVAGDAVGADGSALLVDRRTDAIAAALFTLVAAVPDTVAASDRFMRAQQGQVAGRAWPSSGVAVEAMSRPART